MKSFFERMLKAYARFVDKQGFPIIVTLCVAIITATALWTGRQETFPASPTPPVMENVPAAQLMQQSLREAATATPSPTEAPHIWHPPLAEISVLTPFSLDTMIESGITGLWAVHPAVDLACQRGEKVYAIGDGTVLSAGQDKLQGVWLQIDHGDGVTALYAGMALTADYLPGDAVQFGAVIGYAGNGMLEESALGPHLHLQVWQDGQPIDPATLCESAK